MCQTEWDGVTEELFIGSDRTYETTICENHPSMRQSAKHNFGSFAVFGYIQVIMHNKYIKINLHFTVKLYKSLLEYDLQNWQKNKLPFPEYKTLVCPEHLQQTGAEKKNVMEKTYNDSIDCCQQVLPVSFIK